MKNKLPSINNQTKICIICEGNEEYEYLERLTGVVNYRAKKEQRDSLYDNKG